MSRLVRWRNQEQTELEGDLADLPEMPDDETYIFRIRESARFWDRISGRGESGRAVTAEDIRFNVQRQVEAVNGQGAPDSRFVSADKYRRTASVEVVADRTLVLKTQGPTGSYLGGVHAGPFAWITSPEAVEAFGDRWPDEPNAIELVAGSGFMVPTAFDPDSALVLQRNEGFRRTAGGRPLPHLAGREFRNLLTVSAVQTAYLERRIDEADFPLRRSDIEALQETYPDHDVSARPFGFTVDAWFNFNPNWPGEDGKGNPWVDRRVAFAFHLAIDRTRLADLIYLGDAQLSANALTPWFAGPWAPTEDDLASWPGFRADRAGDIAEARALLDAAAMDDGTAFVLLVPESWEQANRGVRDVMRMMYEQATERAVSLRVEPSDVIARRLAEGTLPGKAPSWSVPPEGIDPTLAFAESLLPNAARNFLHYDYAPVTDLVDRMQVTLDVVERQDLAQRVTRILLGVDAEHGVNGFGAAVGVMNGMQRTIRRPYVHVDADTLQFSAADHNHERSWLDINHPDYAG
jgi:ABC-type transport system substrate-binding protein